MQALSKLALGIREVTQSLSVLLQALITFNVKNIILSAGSMASSYACQIQQPSLCFLSSLWCAQTMAKPSLSLHLIRKLELLPSLTVEHILTSAYNLRSISQALFHFCRGVSVIAHLWTQLHAMVIFATKPWNTSSLSVTVTGQGEGTPSSCMLRALSARFTSSCSASKTTKLNWVFLTRKANSSRGEACQPWYCYCAGKATKNWAEWKNDLKATEYSNLQGLSLHCASGSCEHSSDPLPACW